MVDLTEQNQRGIDSLLGGLEWSKYGVQEQTVYLANLFPPQRPEIVH